MRVVRLGQLFLVTAEAGVLPHSVAGGVAELAALLDLVMTGGGHARQVDRAAAAVERDREVHAGGGARADPQGNGGETTHGGQK